jgi:hypothetical protein
MFTVTLYKVFPLQVIVFAAVPVRLIVDVPKSVVRFAPLNVIFVVALIVADVKFTASTPLPAAVNSVAQVRTDEPKLQVKFPAWEYEITILSAVVVMLLLFELKISVELFAGVRENRLQVRLLCKFTVVFPTAIT